MRKVPYPHPGEILLEEFLKPMKLSQYRLAKEIGVPQRRIGEIVASKRSITADTGLRLSRFFSMSEGFWIGLQMDYEAARAKDALAKTHSPRRLAELRPGEREKSVPPGRHDRFIRFVKCRSKAEFCFGSPCDCGFVESRLG